MLKKLKLLLSVGVIMLCLSGYIDSCGYYGVGEDIEPSYTYSGTVWRSPALGYHFGEYLENRGPWYDPDPQTYDSDDNYDNYDNY